MRVDNDAVGKMAENNVVKLLARGLLIVAIPTGGFFASSTYSYMKELSEEQRKISGTQIEIKTMIQQGLEPRIRTLEKQVSDIRLDLKRRTENQVFKEDIRELKRDLTERINRLEREINNLKSFR